MKKKTNMFSHADPVCGLLPAGTLTLFEEFCKIFCFYFDFKSAIMMAFRWNTLSSWICSEVRTFTGQSCWSSKEIFFYADFRIAELRDCTSAVKKRRFFTPHNSPKPNLVCISNTTLILRLWSWHAAIHSYKPSSKAPTGFAFHLLRLQSLFLQSGL